jgi:hypothetical protein
MFSTVGPTSPWPGGGAATLQAQRAAGLLPEAAATARGEAGASAAHAETAERVDPAAQPAAVPRQIDWDRPGPRFRLLPQPAAPSADPADEPAGPPPAFSRSLLEARRAELASPEPATLRPQDDDPLVAAIRRLIAETEGGPAPTAPGTVDLTL